MQDARGHSHPAASYRERTALPPGGVSKGDRTILARCVAQAVAPMEVITGASFLPDVYWADCSSSSTILRYFSWMSARSNSSKSASIVCLSASVKYSKHGLKKWRSSFAMCTG